MRTKIFVCLVMLGISTTGFSQRHGTRVASHSDKTYKNNRNSHSGEARHTVIITPKPRIIFEAPRPRIIVRPVEPTIVIERNVYRNHSHDYRNYMTDEELCQINRRLQNIRMDYEKVEYIKDKLDFYFVTSSQLSDMIYNLTFESNRLELAKYAYKKTIDPQNFELVYNTLDFHSSKRELDNYIDNQNVCYR